MYYIYSFVTFFLAFEVRQFFKKISNRVYRTMLVKKRNYLDIIYFILKANATMSCSEVLTNLPHTRFKYLAILRKIRDLLAFYGEKKVFTILRTI